MSSAIKAQLIRPRLENLEDRTAPAVLVVNSLADGAPAGDGQLTLREAVLAANTNAPSGDAPGGEAGPDLIVFAANLQGGTISLDPGQGELILTGGGDLSIVGPGGVASGITLNGQNNVRLFSITPNANAVTLNNLTLTGGNAGQGNRGGGLLNQGPNTRLTNVEVTGNDAGSAGGGIATTNGLLLDNVTASNNRAGTNGGGVSQTGGRLEIRNSTITSNFAQTQGGGITTQGNELVLVDSTVSANITNGQGGGVSVVTGTFLIERSTLSGNRSVQEGGGLDITNTSNGTLRNSTIAHNTTESTLAVDGGGGIEINAGNVTLINSTVARNTDTGNGVQGAGGISKSGGSLTLINTIVALNEGGPGTANDNVAPGDVNRNVNSTIGGDPRLGPLQDNGGPTFTFALLPGSSAIDSGSNTDAPGIDQRGFPRPVNGTVDRGAVEFFSPVTTVTLTVRQNGTEISSTSTARGVTLQATVAGSVSGVVPQGEVLFFDDPTGGDPGDARQLNTIPVPLNSTGNASLPNVILAEGPHNLFARYSPSSEAFRASASPARAVTARVTDTVGVFDPQGVVFQLLNQNTTSTGGADFGYSFGSAGSLPVVGNWTGNASRVSLPGVVAPSGGFLLWTLADENPPVLPNLPSFAFGVVGQIPIAGDWDGDGTTGIGLYDPATGIFSLRNFPGQGFADFSFAFGVPGLLPVVGDWDGDNADEVGVYDPASGNWFLSDAANVNVTPALFNQFPFGGGAGTRPIGGDWDGDGTSGIGLFIPQGSGFGSFLLRNAPSAGAPDVNGGSPIDAGLGNWLPLAGNWGPAPLLTNELLALTAAPGPGPEGQLVDDGGLQSFVGFALARLEAAGAGPDLLNTLTNARYALGDLPGGQLAAADPVNGRVLVDTSGAGRGWYFDPTPWEDAEFVSGQVAGYDLLTVLLHEMGHLAGLDHAPEGLLAESLEPGVRWTEALDRLFAAGLESIGTPSAHRGAAYIA